jgi:hypothetical protein
VRAIVQGEVDERRNAADGLRAGHPERAETLDGEAAVLSALLG